MKIQNIVNRTIDIVNLAISPDPIKCIRLINSLIPYEDPISKLAYKLAKSELSAALEIIANFEHEGDLQGALNRILSHLESASILARNFYIEKIEEKNVINKHFVPWFMSKNGQTVNEDIVKICFYQLVCHKLLGSSQERLYQVLSKVPLYSDYEFGNYTEAISRLFNERLWKNIICNRKNEFARNMCTAVDLIDKIPNTFLVPNLPLIKATCFMNLQKYLDNKLDSELSKQIVSKKINYSDCNYYFPRKNIIF